MRTQWSVALILIAVAAGGVYFYRNRPMAVSQPAAPVIAPAPPQSSVVLTGRIRARNVVPVAAPIDGTLESVEVIEGEQVYEGQLLARIKNSSIELAEEQARLEVERIQTRLNTVESQLMAARLEASRAEADASRARAAFAAAEKNYLRQKMLVAEGATPRLTFEKAEKDYGILKSESDAVTEIARQATAKVEIAQKNVEEARKLLLDKNEELDNAKAHTLATEIHAPVDGLLVGHRASAGVEVTHDMKNLFEIARNVTELELVADATPAAAARIKPGQTAVLQIAEMGSEALAGTIKSVNGTQVVVEFNSTNTGVKPGLTGQVRIDVAADKT